MNSGFGPLDAFGNGMNRHTMLKHERDVFTFGNFKRFNHFFLCRKKNRRKKMDTLGRANATLREIEELHREPVPHIEFMDPRFWIPDTILDFPPGSPPWEKCSTFLTSRVHYIKREFPDGVEYMTVSFDLKNVFEHKFEGEDSTLILSNGTIAN